MPRDLSDFFPTTATFGKSRSRAAEIAQGVELKRANGADAARKNYHYSCIFDLSGARLAVA
jgi:hypothetical protein